MPVETPTDDTPHANALRLAALGLRVLPIKVGGKHPPMNAWQHAATDDPAKIGNWYRGLYRNAGTGFAMGPQPCGKYLFAIDVDTHDPDNNGWDSLADLETRHGKLPDTWRSLTGSDGAHLIFAAPAGVTVRNQQAGGNRIAPGIDVRGDGGQIVVAPTIHPDTGRAYAWEHGYAPWEHDIAEAPAWLLEFVNEREPEPAPPKPPRDPNSNDDLFATHRADWDWHTELLGRGWTVNGQHGGDTYWTRPGKNPRDGHSAVLHGTDGPLVIFTTEIPQQWTAAASRTVDGSGWSFGPFGFYAATQHAGDRTAAYKELADKYGTNIGPGTFTVPDEPDTDQNEYDGALLGMLTDWDEFYAVDHRAEEWLWEPIVAAKRSTAIFAKGGVGKSLIVLSMTLDIAAAGFTVLYLDYEMTPDDLYDRLEEMGHHAPSDALRNISYAQLPSIPAFDTPEGGKAVNRLAELVGANLVIIDTFARAVQGDENDADTVRQFYRMTGLHLKASGRAFIRVDHAGKDAAKGQRGSSAKNDDVDVVWQLSRTDDGYALKAEKRRMGWVPEKVSLERIDNPFRLKVAGGDVYPAGTADVVTALDELGVDVTESYRSAARLLREAGRSARNEVIRAALKYRRKRPMTFDPAAADSHNPQTQSGESEPQKSGRTQDIHSRGALRGAPTTETANPQVDDSGRTAGRTRAHPSDATGAQCAPLYGAHAPSVTPNRIPNPFFDEEGS